jgi:hypothetical protein
MTRVTLAIATIAVLLFATFGCAPVPAREAIAFGKPVVLFHGDSHYFRIDEPLTPQRVRGAAVSPALENFTRVEGFGSPYLHWVQVTIDPDEPNVFTFQPWLVAPNLGKRP